MQVAMKKRRRDWFCGEYYHGSTRSQDSEKSSSFKSKCSLPCTLKCSPCFIQVLTRELINLQRGHPWLHWLDFRNHETDQLLYGHKLGCSWMNPSIAPSMNSSPACRSLSVGIGKARNWKHWLWRREIEPSVIQTALLNFSLTIFCTKTKFELFFYDLTWQLLKRLPSLQFASYSLQI